jgi:uncharacterized integral membrane protein
MLIAKGHLDNEVLKQGRGIIGIGYRAGFVLACVLLCVGVVVCLLQRQRAKTRQTTALGHCRSIKEDSLSLALDHAL